MTGCSLTFAVGRLDGAVSRRPRLRSAHEAAGSCDRIVTGRVLEDFEAARERVLLEPTHGLRREEGQMRKQDDVVATEQAD